MSSDLISSIAQQSTIYIGLVLMIGGVVGNIINIVVFTTLRLFRGNQCAFYLTVESINNIGELLIAYFSHILDDGFDINSIDNSLIWCKIKGVFIGTFPLLSLSTVCFAALDQFLSTNPRPNWRQKSSFQLAQCLTVANICFATLHSIPFIIFYEIRPLTGCRIYDFGFNRYYSFVYYHIFLGLFPIFVASLLSLFAYRNVRHLIRRQTSVVRRRLDRQLTAMVLARIAILVIFVLPYLIDRIYLLNVTITQSAVNRLIRTIIFSLYYANFSGSFYIFMAASSRYQRQVKHVLVRRIWRSLKRCFRFRLICVITNQVAPDPGPSAISALQAS